MIQYFITASAYMALFYIIYLLLIRRDTRYRRNRLYLLASLFISLFLPFISITTVPGSLISSLNQDIIGIINIPDVNVNAFIPDQGQANGLPVLLLIYLAGSTTAFIVLIINLLKLYGYVRKYRKEGSRVILTPPGKESGFSALGYIFISSNLEDFIRTTILDHEQLHIRNKHFIDIMFLRVTGIFLWFNPFIYLYEHLLKELHEFETDQQMLDSGRNVISYQRLILNQIFNTSIFTLQNGFSGRSLIKKRMIMMTKKRSSKMSGLKLLFALPVILIVFGLFSCKTEPKEPLEFIDEKDNTETLKEQATESKTTDTPQEIQEDDALFVVEEMPTFQGGDIDVFRNWVMKNVKYPEIAVQNGIQGQVFLMFVVNKEGTVQDVVITRGVDPVLDNEAKRVVESSPKWAPGKHDGKIVPVKFSITVNFRLQ